MKELPKVVALRERITALKTGAFNQLEEIRVLTRQMETAPARIAELNAMVRRLETIIEQGPSLVEELKRNRTKAWETIRALEVELEGMLASEQTASEQTPKGQGTSRSRATSVLIGKLGAGDSSVVPALVEMGSMEWSAWVKKWGHLAV